ncbi:membrane-associated protein, putative [Bodo saltans]|uniref:Membrane-associated protein, putative n=1 Tax=Bodo saltans TaxID=75058 RepID=A0A0S4KHY7_BODSA|nr:membrane-associated protein, putative [Bodo saltans]|eukprot:CUI14740.1 membrane-associated protein, putative [Bodo saltans]
MSHQTLRCKNVVAKLCVRLWFISALMTHVLFSLLVVCCYLFTHKSYASGPLPLSSLFYLPSPVSEKRKRSSSSFVVGPLDFIPLKMNDIHIALLDREIF